MHLYTPVQSSHLYSPQVCCTQLTQLFEAQLTRLHLVRASVSIVWLETETFTVEHLQLVNEFCTVQHLQLVIEFCTVQHLQLHLYSTAPAAISVQYLYCTVYSTTPADHLT